MATCTIRVLPKSTYADIEAAYRCLVEKYGVKEEDVILYGQSVGSGPTLPGCQEENIPCNFLIVSAIRQGIVDDVVDCSHGK
ncbi:hypothetical protein G4B88_008640 [Cannabis sativa]|uniref:Uncharacterized protein n=1 Tax=Cannabis sativa TaxID=3483 RepID=A0A7J6EGF4_CANSA|nr:hypothetical protein G4B88_008640 [Cannabis sativa]